MSEANDPPQNFSEIQNAIDSAFGDLFDMNNRVFSAIRDNISNVEVIRDAFLLQAEKCEEIINLYVLAAEATAQTTGDLILSQYDVQREEVEDDD